MNHSFVCPLGQKVTIGGGTETGVVIGRAEFQHGENSYLVRYHTPDGRCVEAWWGESALSHA